MLCSEYPLLALSGFASPDLYMFLIVVCWLDTLQGQGRDYVANEYPTFLKTMSIDSQKLRISHQIILNRGQICPF